jgi:hypothetical protein
VAYIGLDGALVVEEAIAGRVPVGESFAAYAIRQLAERKLLNRVRQCICGNYLFANFPNQRSCSPACRHRVYEQTEHFKAKRRAYMRAYYRLKVSGKVK